MKLHENSISGFQGLTCTETNMVKLVIIFYNFLLGTHQQI